MVGVGVQEGRWEEEGTGRIGGKGCRKGRCKGKGRPVKSKGKQAGTGLYDRCVGLV